MQQRPAFEQQRADLALGQRLERGAKRAVPRRPRSPRLDPRAGAGRRARAAARRRRHDDDRPGVACREHARVGRRAQLAIEDHPRQRPLAIARRGRSAADRRPGSVPTPTPMASTSARNACACRLAAADVSAVALARRGGEAAVEADRRLEDDERPSFAHQREERLVEPRRGVGAERRPRLDAVRPQIREPAAAAPAGFGSSTAATTRAIPASTMRPTHGPVAADVAAGLERAVQRRAAGARARPSRARALRRAARRRARGTPARRRRRRVDTTTAPTMRIRARPPAPARGDETARAAM